MSLPCCAKIRVATYFRLFLGNLKGEHRDRNVLATCVGYSNRESFAKLSLPLSLLVATTIRDLGDLRLSKDQVSRVITMSQPWSEPVFRRASHRPTLDHFGKNMRSQVRQGKS